MYTVERIIKFSIQGAIFIVYARVLDPEAFGQLSLALTTMYMLGIASNFGLDQIIIRKRSLSNIASLKFCSFTLALSFRLGIFFAVILLLASFILVDQVNEFYLYAIASIALPFSFTPLIQSNFVGRPEGAELSKFLIANSIFFGIIKLITCVAYPNAQSVIMLTSLEQILGALISSRFIKARKWSDFLFQLKSRRRYTFNVMRQALPIFVSIIFAFLYMRTDQYVVKSYLGSSSLALYSVGLKPYEFGLIIIGSIVTSSAAKIVQVYVSDESEFSKSLSSNFVRILFLSVILSIITFIFGDVLFSNLFGYFYSSAGEITAILILAFPALYLGNIASIICVRQNTMGLALKRSISGWIINISLSIYLAGLFGPNGVALATVISFWLSAVVFLSLSRSERAILKSLF